MSAAYPIDAAPFDAVADQYDETFTSSSIGQIQRRAVWKELAKVFRQGDQVLEIGCGTGVDACFLAERGVRVAASDCSAGMLEVARRRIQEKGYQELMSTHLLRAEEIGELASAGSFDGAFSNFGMLNCLDANGIYGLARDLGRMLRPGAAVLLCWMGPLCLWETAWYLARGDSGKAFRRLHRSGVTAKIADGGSFHVFYPSVRSLVRAFSPEFRVKSLQGIGLTVPPSYVEGWARQHPEMLKFLGRVDTIVAHSPGLRLLADHILVRFERARP